MTGLLAFHTATDLCEIALQDESGVRTLRADGPRAHSERLVPLVLEMAGGDLTKVRGIAVAAGPGSFTGLRIGLSTAKGIAFGLGVPLFAVSTLAALAWSAGRARGKGLYVPIMRARRDELYAGVYGADANGVHAVGHDAVVTEDALVDWIGDRVRAEPDPHIVGPRAVQITESAAAGHPAFDVNPGAAAILELSAGRPDAYIVNDIASFEPYYCKEFVARTPRTSIFDRLPF